jgi:putative oxidoreductase
MNQSANTSTTVTIGLWLLRLLPAVIMLQTLFFKFSGAAESVYIFTQMGIEPWGRIGTGIAEAIASLLLLWPRTTWLGALLGLGIMSGALVSHALVLGYEIMGDGGQLFWYAAIVWICCGVLMAIHRRQIKNDLPFTQKQVHAAHS